MSKVNQSTGELNYRIGAVSRLTGVAPDTLRVWERRYGTVTPFRPRPGRACTARTTSGDWR